MIERLVTSIGWQMDRSVTVRWVGLIWRRHQTGPAGAGPSTGRTAKL